MSQATTEIPPRLVEMSITSPRPGSDKSARTAITFNLGFDKVKHLLSDRPLRRPNRGRPLVRSVCMESGTDELTRRKLLQRRMPPRSRIQAILDQRPAHDLWLDDEHDWRP